MSVARSALSPIATYTRDVAASLERIWENVLDWEHLPWLHRGAFLGVRPITASRDGWRAEVQLPPARAPRSAEITVALDRPALRYVTATVAGFGAGTEIVTDLAPTDAHATAVTVAFHVPGLAAEQRDAAAAAYTRLYARLWDEDEAMMVRRQALLDAKHAGARDTGPVDPLVLGDVAAVRARLPWILQLGRREIRLIALGDAIVAHTTVCPHLGGPLGDAPLAADGSITCPWHGYRFDVATARSADDRLCRLDPAPRVVVDAASGIVSLVSPSS